MRARTPSPTPSPGDCERKAGRRVCLEPIQDETAAPLPSGSSESIAHRPAASRGVPGALIAPGGMIAENNPAMQEGTKKAALQGGSFQTLPKPVFADGSRMSLDKLILAQPAAGTHDEKAAR